MTILQRSVYWCSCALYQKGVRILRDAFDRNRINHIEYHEEQQKLFDAHLNDNIDLLADYISYYQKYE